MVYPMMWNELGTGFMALMFIAMLWEAVWKGIGLWKAGRNRQPAWFVFIFILNTLGILPIIYIAFFQKKPAAAKPAPRRKR